MSKFTPDQKLAGALIPLFALRGDHDLGVGDTEALKEFVHWAASHGMRAVQILPINETGSDHSPYNILSSMAIEPCTLATHPHVMVDLSDEDFHRITAEHPCETMRGERVSYPLVKALKFDLLRAGFQQFSSHAAGDRRERFEAFRHDHRAWIDAYATYRSFVHLHGTEVTDLWPEAHRSPAGADEWLVSLPEAERELFEYEIEFRAYIQWIAYEQWDSVRETCAACGVALVGDIPVGVSIFSADVWQEPEIFDRSRSCGAPPERVFASDPFTAKWGQNWGFPLYDWYAMSHDNFAWWRRRLRMMRQMFDMTRVDHALGFFRIYSFPWRPEFNAEFLDLSPEEAEAKTGGLLPGFVPQDDSTPENRDKNRRHGETLFKLFLDESDPHCLIAEDLGDVAPYVRPVLEQLEIPGFKIPQWERETDGSLTPGESYPRLSLATYATHDHPPVKAFWNDWFDATQSDNSEAAAHALAGMRELMAFAGQPDIPLPCPFDSAVHRATLQGLLACNAWLVIPMITDILGIDDRFNVPGATGDQNWSARLSVPVRSLDTAFQGPLHTFHEAMDASGR